MSKIERLEQLVRQLYEAKDPNRAEWADWLGENHVFLVANNAVTLARQVGANEELARAAALLHDIADAKMSRFADDHGQASLTIARELMQQAGFDPDEIELTVDDAIRYHSCHDGHAPSSTEGKVLATADSQAHLQTDFYIYATWAMSKDKSLEDIKTWVLKKLDRDFNNKILFDDVREDCRKDYESLRALFSR